ncbi:MAG: Sb-PDE family phosphodiesterase [Bacteroidales bacterium]|nr:Sb-PDE family phosphodiesterase [Bacteroidales bacterium]
MRFTILIFLFTISIHLSAQHNHDRKIQFPDIPGYKTLKCDFHQHTVFSDGSVWPDIRVQEAIKDGLDAISITDHIEYQPHSDDIPHADRNRPYQITKEAAKNSDLVVINGSEITRDMPPGHANAIFLQDANELFVDDSIEVFRAAKNQDAFIFWNHPHWTAQAPTGIASLTETHKKLLNEGLLNGIEVVNDVTYSDEALQIALDYNLTIMGTSDIHGLIDWQYHVPHGGHRPVTLVFAEEKSEEGIKDALINRRTAVWFNNILIGRPEFLVPLIEQSMSVVSASYKGETSVLALTIENNSDVDFILENGSDFTLHRNADVFTVKANDFTRLEIKTIERLEEFKLYFKILNAVTAPKTHPEINLNIQVD